MRHALVALMASEPACGPLRILEPVVPPGPGDPFLLRGKPPSGVMS